MKKSLWKDIVVAGILGTALTYGVRLDGSDGNVLFLVIVFFLFFAWMEVR